ncbi:MAG: endolytic transglycosylase MltG [Defluviitaleaceae bacterium]|nr:endolytic transglycosylase MltG [Defluviitaleaceae bacterium]
MWRKVVDISNYLFGGLFNIGLAVGLVVIAFFVVSWAFDQGMEVFSPEDAYFGEPVRIVVEIPEGASPLEIGRILREYELINNEWIFQLESMLNGSAAHLLSGSFPLYTGMNNSQIMHILQSPYYLIHDEGRVVIIEGRTNRQIADIAATLGYFTADEFLYEAENGFFPHSFLIDVAMRQNRLEGFLFPDTYHLPPNPTPRDLIMMQLNQFGEVFGEQMWAYLADLYATLGWQPTLEEVIIVASIIEMEAIVLPERRTVASVIYNRLAAGMNLEMITTVVYAANRRADLLTTADFNINSPYNTFNRAGLPIGAISNPGLSAIEAALNPANTNYLFMLKYDDGSHDFFETRAEYDTARAGE